MRKIYFIVLVLLVSCSHFGDRTPAQQMPVAAFPLEDTLGKEVAEFQVLVEQALVWRSMALGFAQSEKDKFKKNLSHEDMLLLEDSAKNYLVLRDKIMEFAHRYEQVVQDGAQVEFTPGKGTTVGTIDASTNSSTGNDGVTTVPYIKIDPTDAKGRDLLIRTKISLAAALVLYDNYMIGVYPYLNNKKTRKMLNEDIIGYRNKLDSITDSFFDLNNRNKMVKAITLFKADLQFKKEKGLDSTREENYLDLLSRQSPFYEFISQRHSSVENPGVIRAYFDRFFDRAQFINESFAFIVSKVFGNTVGLVAFREGLLKNLPSDEKKDIAAEMKPLDIMLEKTPFRLTDQFIPGYYGHVAIWVGSESELKALGVWDDPAVVKYHKDIIAGKRIIEALRPGVQINTLNHFLDIDDLLVLRDPNLTAENRKEFLIRAFQQVGKEYDFNFDVETDSKIVCSEIVYVVFHDIAWPTKQTLGRYTISPDNVASKVFEDNGVISLEPVLMYRSGQRVQSALVPEIRDVMGENPKP